jgi:hypothetical protein
MLARIFGANWKTTVSGIGAALFGLLTILAALPYEMGDLANLFPPAWKAKIAATAAVAAALLKVWNSVAQKSKEVTGGMVQQTVSGAVADPGTQSLVDETVKASIRSGEPVTAEQKNAVLNR